MILMSFLSVSIFDFKLRFQNPALAIVAIVFVAGPLTGFAACYQFPKNWKIRVVIALVLIALLLDLFSPFTREGTIVNGEFVALFGGLSARGLALVFDNDLKRSNSSLRATELKLKG